MVPGRAGDHRLPSPGQVGVTTLLPCMHEADEIKGGLVLDSRRGWTEGGKTGPAIVPGKPEDSLLFRAVSHTLKDKDLQMPPKRKLDDAAIDKLRQWIVLGAPDPRESTT